MLEAISVEACQRGIVEVARQMPDKNVVEKEEVAD
jgi:hypothetical protein